MSQVYSACDFFISVFMIVTKRGGISFTFTIFVLILNKPYKYDKTNILDCNRIDSA